MATKLRSEEQRSRSPSHSAEDRCATGSAKDALVPTAFLNAAEDGFSISHEKPPFTAEQQLSLRRKS